jgi:hypothetical protein
MSRWREKLLSRQVGRTAQLRDRDASRARRSILGQPGDVLSERRLKFTADHAVGYAIEEVVLVKRSVEPEVADVALRIQSPDQLTGFDAESDRRVHGSRDPHKIGPSHLDLVDNLDGEIQAFHSMAAVSE